jgi:hypothetical protein
MVMKLQLNTVPLERIRELEIMCILRYRELVAEMTTDLPYLQVLEELCKFATSVEEVCLISASAGKFLLK